MVPSLDTHLTEFKSYIIENFKIKINKVYANVNLDLLTKQKPCNNKNNNKKLQQNIPTPRVPTKIPTMLASLALSTR